MLSDNALARHRFDSLLFAGLQGSARTPQPYRVGHLMHTALYIIKLGFQSIAVIGAFALWALLALGLWVMSPNVNRTSSDHEI
jgi:hypothetical protein